MLDAGPSMTSGEVYFEFLQLGRQVRVAAVDAATGIEVVVIAPVSATKTQMQQMALGKLHKKLTDAPSIWPKLV